MMGLARHSPPASNDGAAQVHRFFILSTFYLALFLILFQLNGAPLSLAGIALSNLFVAAFMVNLLVSSNFYWTVPQFVVMPLVSLISLAMVQLAKGQVSAIVFALQAYLFFLFAISIVKSGLLRRYVIFAFLFIASSQFYLLAIHGGTLPIGDLGGFYVSRRTIHSLSLGYFAILVVPLLPVGWRRVAFIAVVFLVLLVSQARGAAILFGLVMLVGRHSGLLLRGRIVAFLLGIVAVGISVALSPDILRHFQVLTSFTGGSSTGYRVYLLQLLVDELDRYWLFGIPEAEVQRMLAIRFTAGRQDITFALDNTFVYFALRYGGLVSFFLLLIAARLVLTFQPIAIYFVGWLFLDDILGSGLGWFLLGTALALTAQTRVARTGNQELRGHSF